MAVARDGHTIGTGFYNQLVFVGCSRWAKTPYTSDNSFWSESRYAPSTPTMQSGIYNQLVNMLGVHICDATTTGIDGGDTCKEPRVKKLCGSAHRALPECRDAGRAMPELRLVGLCGADITICSDGSTGHYTTSPDYNTEDTVQLVSGEQSVGCYNYGTSDIILQSKGNTSGSQIITRAGESRFAPQPTTKNGSITGINDGMDWRLERGVLVGSFSSTTAVNGLDLENSIAEETVLSATGNCHHNYHTPDLVCLQSGGPTTTPDLESFLVARNRLRLLSGTTYLLLRQGESCSFAPFCPHTTYNNYFRTQDEERTSTKYPLGIHGSSEVSRE